MTNFGGPARDDSGGNTEGLVSFWLIRFVIGELSFVIIGFHCVTNVFWEC